MVTGLWRRFTSLLLCAALLSLFACAGSAATGFVADISIHRWAGYHFPFQDWRRIKAQFIAESNLDQSARSAAGAIGIAQLMPGTAADLKVNPYDPDANVEGGIRYDRQLWDAWVRVQSLEDRWAFTFASYNAGPGWIIKAQAMANALTWAPVALALPRVTGTHATETVQYVSRINLLYAGLRGQ